MTHRAGSTSRVEQASSHVSTTQHLTCRAGSTSRVAPGSTSRVRAGITSRVSVTRELPLKVRYTPFRYDLKSLRGDLLSGEAAATTLQRRHAATCALRARGGNSLVVRV